MKDARIIAIIIQITARAADTADISATIAAIIGEQNGEQGATAQTIMSIINAFAVKIAEGVSALG